MVGAGKSQESTSDEYLSHHLGGPLGSFVLFFVASLGLGPEKVLQSLCPEGEGKSS